jgi:hypothetical protein
VNTVIVIQWLSELLAGATRIVELINRANAEKRDITIAELAELTRVKETAPGPDR